MADFVCGILFKHGFEEQAVRPVRRLLFEFAVDCLDMGVPVAWNTQYDMICDPETPGTPYPWQLKVSCGGEYAPIIKAALQARLEIFFETGEYRSDDEDLEALKLVSLNFSS